MKSKIKKVLVGLGFPLLVIPMVVAMPAAAATQSDNCNTGVSFFPRWYDGLCKNGEILSPNQVGSSGSGTEKTAGNLGTWITIIALNIVSMLLYAVGYTSLGFIIYGGFKYMTSGDNSSGQAAARKTILNAVIGLVLSIMAVAIVKFVADAVAGGGTTGGTP